MENYVNILKDLKRLTKKFKQLQDNSVFDPHKQSNLQHFEAGVKSINILIINSALRNGIDTTELKSKI